MNRLIHAALPALAALSATAIGQTAQADVIYTEIASFQCFSGQCQPGLPVSQMVEGWAGTFVGSLMFGGVFTLTTTGSFAVQTSLPGAGPYYVGTPFRASDSDYYIPVSEGSTTTVFKYDSTAQTIQGYGVPAPVQSGSLVESPDQLLFGASIPVNGAGTVYSLDLAGNAALVSNVPESEGIGTLLESSTGTLFALTVPFSGSSTSSLLQINPGSRIRTLATFPKASASLAEASDGNFYGCGASTLFRVTPAGDYSVIYTFPGGPTGSGAYGCVVQASDGKLYGTTYDGGAFGYGTVFSATLAGAVSTVYSFSGTEQEQRSSQYAPKLLQGSDGMLYGMTTGPYANSPGTNVGGTVFKLDLGLPRPLPVLLRESATSAAPGASVLLTGKNLLGTTSVKINNTKASFVQESGDYLSLTVPANARSGKLTVTTPNGSVTSTFTLRVRG